jgi:hypothetical protein
MTEKELIENNFEKEIEYKIDEIQKEENKEENIIIDNNNNKKEEEEENENDFDELKEYNDVEELKEFGNKAFNIRYYILKK